MSTYFKILKMKIQFDEEIVRHFQNPAGFPPLRTSHVALK